jgi:tRNA pseudouridine55 synthase
MALYGLVILDKPPGATSRRAVDQVVRLVKPAKVGHAGTLDPLASGVLVVGIGAATRLVEYVQSMPKTYRATFLLGRSSTTEDIEGEMTFQFNPPRPTLAALQQAASQLVGETLQRPPAFSALKVAGQRAYVLARAGEAVELAARPVQIQRIAITRYEYPELCCEVDCGSGTYIRSLGRDLAELVGTTAVMSALVRTAIGPFALDRAIRPTELSRENIEQHLLSAVLAVRGLMPERRVSAEGLARLANGLAIDAGQLSADASSADESNAVESGAVESGAVAALDADGRLAAILGRCDDGRYTPVKYLAAR